VITLLSSCLEGANKEQKFYVMQGPGSNGKSMIEQLMENTFGDYGTSLSTTVFTRKKPDSGAANPDIITVKCRRYIHMGEPDDAEKINTSIMKQYSGGDRVAARGLFEDQDKFVITGKIFMSCNDLPTVTKMDNGTWRRIRVIPHVSVFKDPGDSLINPSKNIYEKDLDLENKLRHLRTAFLSLLVHYYDTKYLVHGLREPDCVSAASNRYKEENDIFMVFFNENFVKVPGAGPVMAIDVKKAWREWKRGGNKLCDLKEHQVLERMKETCGSGSTEKEFWGVQIADETDLSGSRLLTPVA
jgi:putative DNA primase/helicase